jgi:hypothetical protein
MSRLNKRVKILGFVGSLRKGSYNKALMRAAVELLPKDALLAPPTNSLSSFTTTSRVNLYHCSLCAYKVYEYLRIKDQISVHPQAILECVSALEELKVTFRRRAQTPKADDPS